MNIILEIIYGIIVIGVIALVHEYGHYYAAKKSGIAVEEFSIGFGPAIFHKEVGGTIYKVCAIPILGYTKIKGMEDNLDAPDGFYKKGLWQRFITIFMGPGMNFILAVILFAIVFSSFGNPFVHTTQISGLVQGDPAYRAGLQKGDKIIEINGKPVKTWEEMTNIIRNSNGKKLQIVVNRKGKDLSFEVTPKKDPTGGWVIGIYSSGGEKYSLFKALWEGVVWTGKLLYKMIVFIPLLFTWRGVSSIAGPIGITVMTGQAAKGGLINLLWFSAIINVAIGFTNLLPIPALDGSWIVLILWEAITRKPIPPEKQLSVQSAGFVFLLGFMALVSVHDIMRLIGK